MNKHIFSKAELNALSPNARIAVLSGHWWINVEGEPITPEYAKQISEKSEREGFIKNYHGSLDATWELVAYGTLAPKSVYFFTTVIENVVWWQCTINGYTGSSKPTMQEAIIDTLYSQDGYWQRAYNFYVYDSEAENPPDFETWMQTTGDKPF